MPNAVRAIKLGAFHNCTGLTRVIVIFGVGLEERRLGEEAFKDCTSMEEIVIPNAVRAIKEAAFRMGLTRATLGDGLEEIEIGEMAFGYCSSMEEIVIPSAVREDTRHLI